MHYYTKEYYTSMMAMDSAEDYEPVMDKEYTEEDIEDLYQQALDRYIEEERAEYDAPPHLFFDEDDDPEDLDPESFIFFAPDLFDDFEEGAELVPRHPADHEELAVLMTRMNERAVEAYENRLPFDEEAAAEEFEEMYRDNLEEPDEDLPEWVRRSVDPRMLAMYCMPEKIYRKLSAEDAANEALFDALDERADEAMEKLRNTLPEQYVRLMDIFEDLEDSCVVDMSREDGDIEFILVGWNDRGNEEARVLRFRDVTVIEDEGIEINAWEDEDGDSDSDCELLYTEIYMEDGRPEVHMLFDNNGLKYLTLRCSGMHASYGWNNIVARID